MQAIDAPAAITLATFGHFQELEDPRIDRTKKHLLLDIIALSVCAVISGAEGWEDIEAYGKDKHHWLKTFLTLPNGIPSHDTIGRVFRRLNPEGFQRCFMLWVESLNQKLGLKLIAIDGKTIRRSFDRNSAQKALHVVSAWSVQNHLTLGQSVVDEKSNEITAIPELLQVLDVSGAVITIDAMGCQKDIAHQIVVGGGDYVLAVKDNQPNLHAAIHAHFLNVHEGTANVSTIRSHVTCESGHGREEERHYLITSLPEEIATKKNDWKGLKSVGQVISYTTRNGVRTSEVRYYACSIKPAVRKFAEAVRGHWAIENSCHWVLDMTFNEDQSRIRRDHGPENFCLLRRLALSMIKQDSSEESIRRRRKRAGWNDANLIRMLAGST